MLGHSLVLISCCECTCPAGVVHLYECGSRIICVKLTTYAGYVAIVGKPNAGKSTLLNAIMRQKLSIVTSKAQTTRHRIIAAHSEDDFQCIFLDTPGVLRPVCTASMSLLISCISSGTHV